MSADDIRIAVDFWEHPKTQKLERRLGLVAVKALIKLWMWAAKNRPNGDLGGLDDEDLIIAAGWSCEGDLVAALVDLKWLDGEPTKYSLHDWQIHNPWAASAEERSGASRFLKLAQVNKPAYDKLKKQGVESLTKEQFAELAYRSAPRKRTAVRNASAAHCSKLLAPSSKFLVPSSEFQEPTPEGEEDPPTPQGATDGARRVTTQSGNSRPALRAAVAGYTNSEPLQEAFEDFRAMRERIRKPMTGKALGLIFSKLDTLSDDDAEKIAILEQSILNSWQGVFPLKTQIRGSPPVSRAEQRQATTINAVKKILEDIGDGE